MVSTAALSVMDLGFLRAAEPVGGLAGFESSAPPGVFWFRSR